MQWLIVLLFCCSVFGDEKPVDWALTSPESGEPIALVIKQELYSMKIRGSFVSLATTTKDQWPEQQVSIVACAHSCSSVVWMSLEQSKSDLVVCHVSRATAQGGAE